MTNRTNFRAGEMLQYKTPDMPRMYYVMVKRVIDTEGELGGLYECMPISPGFNMTPGVDDFLAGKYLTRFM